MYHGDFRLGDTFDVKFTTRQVSGAPTTLAGSPVISAYPGNSTTQLTAGITLTVDFDGVTGLHNIRVVASGGNGYASATDYALVITTGTVNSVSVVGEVVASFSIEHRSALMPTTAARTLDVTAANKVNGVVLTDTLTTYTGNTVQTGDAYARLGAPAGASVSADVAAVKGFVDDIGVAGAGLTALGDARIANLDAAVSTRLATSGYTVPPTANAIADQVWDEVLAGHLTAGSTGAALNAAGAAGDPWSTSIPGAYGAGTAGKILGDNIDATISSRAAASDLTTAQADLDNIQTRLPAALVSGRMDSSVGAMASNVLTAAAIASSALSRAKFAIDTGLRSVHSGTTPGAAIAGATTIPLDPAQAVSTDDAYNGMMFVGAFTNGESRLIVDYNGTTQVITVAPPLVLGVPAFSTYSIMPWGPASVTTWAWVPVTTGDVAITTLATLLAGVATEILDALRTDTLTVPTGVPGDTVPLAEAVGRLYQALINGIVVDSGTNKLQFKNAAGTVIWEKDLTDDGTTYTESKGNGP